VQMATAPVIGRSMAVSYVAGGLFLGLLLGGAAVALATVLREVYIMPAEAERELLLPSLASLDSSGSKLHVDDRPELADLGMLLQEVTVDGRPLASLQIIGTADGDNKAAIVRALAAELATGQERRTLILDLEENGSAYVAALGMAPEGSVPKRSLPIEVAATRTPRLWVGIGALQSVLVDRGGSVARTRRILDELHQDFDVLLLIAPADPSDNAVRRFAMMVDANIMIVRAERTRGAVAMHLCDTIRAAGGNLLGFIFDGRKYYVPNWLYRWA
jgi:Mrp family chromosome partitioning ATPase